MVILTKVPCPISHKEDHPSCLAKIFDIAIPQSELGLALLTKRLNENGVDQVRGDAGTLSQTPICKPGSSSRSCYDAMTPVRMKPLAA